MRIAVKYIPVVLSIFLLGSCGVKNNPVSNQSASNPAAKAAFVVDNVQYNIVSKKQSDGSYTDYLQYNISYHFANAAGTLKDFGIEPSGAAAYMMIGEGSKVIPANKSVTLQSEYSLGRKLTRGETVDINLSLTGTFTKNNGETSSASENFDVSKNFKLKIG